LTRSRIACASISIPLLCPSIFIDVFGPQKLTTARSAAHFTGLPERVDELVKRIEGFGIHRVIHPSPIPSILDQARFLQHLKMKREPRLPGLELVRQFTDTALAVLQLADDVQSGLVRKGMKQLCRPR